MVYSSAYCNVKTKKLIFVLTFAKKIIIIWNFYSLGLVDPDKTYRDSDSSCRPAGL